MKKNRTELTLEELYGFADEKVVRRYQEKYAKFFQSGPILDIGCGRGIFLEILKKNGIEALGIDQSSEVVESLRRKGLAAFTANALNFLKTKKNQYRGIFCSHLIEHHTPEQVRQLLKYCFQSLKSEGILVIITPNPQDLRVITEIFWLDQTHIRPYPLKLLEQLLKQEGFKLLDQGVDEDTKLRHFKTKFLDRISKKVFSRLPLGPFFNTGHDIFMVGKKL